MISKLNHFLLSFKNLLRKFYKNFYFPLSFIYFDLLILQEHCSDCHNLLTLEYLIIIKLY